MADLQALSELEADVEDIRNMAVLTRDFVDQLFAKTRRGEAFLIMDWQVSAARFCVFHLDEMIGEFEDAYFAAINRKRPETPNA